ncbi:imidazoleglycerol-phosphate dehydratase HisB [Cellulosilyticum lentocellum]|uniref:Imidazoleglycerol-phosphate dehydratase n=1 Tax=Cellulosilyticum lentocellum (strain ATCC 49066 / DSM 5427 / NCIMB 11756 / RHM5) TaxID=642492 RepID=F2JGU9_CELLD|nr:imidazoleglycerol-phosphate dehydratase HisB [Cellulosilyticum lentocellum]ADZ84191.1 Imidazoleglycerol-phosphate dehydratase [Cellulosilyticum lentocellum DSM 5427]
MRSAQIKRDTAETKITLSLNIDGEGKTDIHTGIGFFDHMLTHIGKHSLSDLKVNAVGDIEIDCHHTVEDTGIVLGQAFKAALGNKEGINRYGHAIVPMDEALVLCAVDLSGRPYVDVDTPFTIDRLGDFDTEMVEEFFRAVAVHAGMNLHIQVIRGKNNHHIIEGMCKAFAKAMLDAMSFNPRIKGVPSTKGMLEV